MPPPNNDQQQILAVLEDVLSWMETHKAIAHPGWVKFQDRPPIFNRVLNEYDRISSVASADYNRLMQFLPNSTDAVLRHIDLAGDQPCNSTTSRSTARPCDT